MADVIPMCSKCDVEAVREGIPGWVEGAMQRLNFVRWVIRCPRCEWNVESCVSGPDCREKWEALMEGDDGSS